MRTPWQRKNADSFPSASLLLFCGSCLKRTQCRWSLDRRNRTGVSKIKKNCAVKSSGILDFQKKVAVKSSGI
jgi:hypothetical protein